MHLPDNNVTDELPSVEELVETFAPLFPPDSFPKNELERVLQMYHEYLVTSGLTECKHVIAALRVLHNIEKSITEKNKDAFCRARKEVWERADSEFLSMGQRLALDIRAGIQEYNSTLRDGVGESFDETDDTSSDESSLGSAEDPQHEPKDPESSSPAE